MNSYIYHELIEHRNLKFSRVYANNVSFNCILDMYKFYKIEIPSKFKHVGQKKILEFLLGRIALHYQQDKYQYYFDLKNGRYGQPLWPSPFLGSISHSMISNNSGIAVSYLNSTNHHVGIDIELKKNSLLLKDDENILNQFLKNTEKENVKSLINKHSLLYLIIFSSKESIIKAVFSKYQVLINFHDIEFLVINSCNGKISFKLKKPFVVEIDAYFLILSEDIISYCILEH